jgi:hypothetical protein
LKLTDLFAAAALVGGAIYGAGFYTYLSYRVSPLIIGTVLLLSALLLRVQGRNRNLAFASGLFAASTAVIAAPLFVYFSGHPADLFARTSQVSVLSDPQPWSTAIANCFKTVKMFFFSGDTNWRHNISGVPDLYWPVALFFALGIVSWLPRLTATSAVRNAPCRRSQCWCG